MFAVTLTIAVTCMAGLLFYQEQHDSSLNAEMISSGWFALGLMLRIILAIVMLVLITLSIAALTNPV